MSPRLEALLIWFLEFGKSYMLISGIFGGILLLAIGLLWAKDQDWSGSVLKVFPLFLMPTMMRMVVPLIEPYQLTDPIFSLILRYVDFFYFIPILVLIGSWFQEGV